jgi:hypothetical protein
VTGAALPRPEQRAAIPATLAVFAAAVVLVVAWTARTGNPIPILVPLVGLTGFAATHRVIMRWPSLIGALIVVILAIPIRRYALPSGLPFELEPYRLVVAGLAACWMATMLIEPRFRFPRTPLNAPLVLLVITILFSVAVNSKSIGVQGIDDVVLKKVTFFLSFVAVTFMVATVVRTRRDIDNVVKALVIGGGALALLAIIESRTSTNVFNSMHGALPFLEFNHEEVLVGDDALGRGGRARAYASAQHPIALGAALVVLTPLALYLVQATGRRIWWVPTALLAVGAIGSVSRTPFLMLVAVGLVLLWFKPRQARRAAPAVLAMVVLVHAVLPGAIGGIKGAFFPEGGLVAEQQQKAGQVGSGRVADVGPALDQWATQPFLGQGWGTRITPPDDRSNAMVLDNQWLASLLEVGAIGVFAMGWLLVRGVRQLRKIERLSPTGPRGWLATCLAASITAFGVGMLTYDAFSFIQVTVLIFIVFGLAISLLRLDAAERSGLVGGKLAR